MSDESPLKILERDKVFVDRLKKENERLKEQIKVLLKNNKTFTELIEVLEDKILSLSRDVGKKYVYDYERGGWIIDGSLDKQKMELKKDKVDVRKLNQQLAEIIRLMKMHKVKHLRREQEINNKVSGVEKVGDKEEES